jgi:phosphate transport system substrate-binding protein
VPAAGGAAAEGQPQDFRASITNKNGKDAYPISTYMWLLLPEEIADKTRRDALTELLRWVLTSGQRECSALGYAPLPAEIAKRALESFDTSK